MTNAHTPDASRNAEILQLSRDLVDDIELSRLTAESLLLKAARLFRLLNEPKLLRWVNAEILGYSLADEVAVEYMGYTGRWVNRAARTGIYQPLAQIEAQISALSLQLQMLRVPDVSFSIHSANPSEHVTLGAFGTGHAPDPAKAVNTVVSQAQSLTTTIGTLAGIRTKVRGLLHSWATHILHQRAFGALTQTIFEQYKATVDQLLAERCGDVLERLPAVYDRLAAGDAEAVSHAQVSARRIIDSFTDAVFPPTNETIPDGSGGEVKLTEIHHLNRLREYMNRRVQSTSRRQKLKQTMNNLYGRVSAGVHTEISLEEARALLLETYLLLGELITLPDPTPSTAALPNPAFSEQAAAASALQTDLVQEVAPTSINNAG
jgi:hypothetical protein